MMHPAALAVTLAGLLPAVASAQDHSWTPCHWLATGGKLQELCRACEGQGLGWRFYVSRNGAQTQCQRDPQANSGIYRKPWEEDDKAVRKSIIKPVRPVVVPAPTPPRPESQSYAPSIPSAPKMARTDKAAPSAATTAGTRNPRPVREIHEPRSPASHASVPPRPSTEQKRASSPPPQQPRSEAENRRESERRRELKKSEP